MDLVEITKYGTGGALVIGAFTIYKLVIYVIKKKESVDSSPEGRRVSVSSETLQTCKEAAKDISELKMNFALMKQALVTRDDLDKLFDKVTKLNMEQAKNLTDAMQGGFIHAHERIDEILQRAAG